MNTTTTKTDLFVPEKESQKIPTKTNQTKKKNPFLDEDNTVESETEIQPKSPNHTNKPTWQMGGLNTSFDKWAVMQTG
jgi:hypothetical protein